ncbi:MAG: fibronectin type III domain-containing protein [Candidatus Poribacteria bacterium]|nr:fibronectin type III domain-containing protein [Candidatus Poribacteria bacterium]
MLLKITRTLSILLLTILFVGISGCYIDTNESDGEPPAIPRGVRTITGDEQVVIEWYPNGEFDLAGYRVWRGRDDVNFNDLLVDVSENTTHYTDADVRNGETYYYAVSAYDTEGNESELSPENAWDTPRPEGRNITLDDYLLFPGRSGFDFSQPYKGCIHWDTAETDIYFGLDTEVGVTYLYSDNQTLMQDLGYHEDFESVDFVPEFGYTTVFVELIEGHIYAFYTPDGNFAKIQVRELFDDAVIFDWAYQTDPDNIQLAPPLNRP